MSNITYSTGGFMLYQYTLIIFLKSGAQFSMNRDFDGSQLVLTKLMRDEQVLDITVYDEYNHQIIDNLSNHFNIGE